MTLSHLKSVEICFLSYILTQSPLLWTGARVFAQGLYQNFMSKFSYTVLLVFRLPIAVFKFESRGSNSFSEMNTLIVTKLPFNVATH